MRTLIVGSGAGGAAVFRTIAGGRDVTVLEAGPPLKACGPTGLADKNYEIINTGEMEIWQALCDGGSTVVSLGNGVRALEEECKAQGVDIGPELDILEGELGIIPTPHEAFGDTSRALFEIMESSGHNPTPMPKFTDFSRCSGCGRCAFGCIPRARWDARRFLYKAKLVNGFRVRRVLHDGKVVTGVEGSHNDTLKIVKADEVVLAAGAIHTPGILQASGIEAGDTLFVDPFVTVGGFLPDSGQDREIPMAFYADLGDCILSPHYSVFLHGKLKKDPRDIAALMVKIRDDNLGRVEGNKVEKTLTERDRRLLEEGIEKAKEVLEEAGAKDVTATHVRGVHQGGTFPLKDGRLDTDIKGLYVADASLLPEAPGKPPMLAVMALARKVGQHILEA